MARPRQSELFPNTTGFKPIEADEPELWVRELRVYRELAPGDHNLVRRISLRPGLNVLWARPSDRENPVRLHAPGVSGHGTGKTTFCRFIRHVLGEASFGNEDQRQRLRLAFPEGWIVAEIRLNRESWLVCRPFKVGPHSYCFHGRRIEDLFSEGVGLRKPFDEYLAELNRALVEPLAVATFATSPTVIGWPHALQWLTRDQECRFAALSNFRDPDSQSLAPDMAFEDRHFLFRAILQLIDTPEQSELESSKRLNERKQETERRIPLLRFRAEATLERMRHLLPEFRTDLSGSDFLMAVEIEWLRQSEAEDAQRAAMPEPDELRTARLALIDRTTNPWRRWP